MKTREILRGMAQYVIYFIFFLPSFDSDRWMDGFKWEEGLEGRISLGLPMSSYGYGCVFLTKHNPSFELA